MSARIRGCRRVRLKGLWWRRQPSRGAGCYLALPRSFVDALHDDFIKDVRCKQAYISIETGSQQPPGSHQRQQNKHDLCLTSSWHMDTPNVLSSLALRLPLVIRTALAGTSTISMACGKDKHRYPTSARCKLSVTCVTPCQIHQWWSESLPGVQLRYHSYHGCQARTLDPARDGPSNTTGRMSGASLYGRTARLPEKVMEGGQKVTRCGGRSMRSPVRLKMWSSCAPLSCKRRSGVLEHGRVRWSMDGTVVK